MTSNRAALLLSVGTDLVVQDRGAPPVPKTGEILVRNHAVAINPVDWKRAALGFAIRSFPCILGSDISGTVIAVGPDTTPSFFSPGDRIFAYADEVLSGDPLRGAFQEYTIVQAAATSRMPPNLTFEEAAVLPVGMSTAALALFRHLGLPRPLSSPASSAAAAASSEETLPPVILLVLGGASSVGSCAIQLARQASAAAQSSSPGGRNGKISIIATASARNHAYVRSLGVDEVVDYKGASPGAVAQDIMAAAQRLGGEVTHVLDAVSEGDTWETVAALARARAQVSSLPSEKKKEEEKLKVAHLLPPPAGFEVPEENVMETAQVWGHELFGSEKDLLVWLFNEYLSNAVERGDLVASPRVRAVRGGVDGFQEAMEQCKGGVSAEKVVVTFAE